MKDKNHKIITIGTEIAPERSQHSFMTKTLNKVGTEGMSLNIMKTIHDKATANLILNGES